MACMESATKKFRMINPHSKLHWYAENALWQHTRRNRVEVKPVFDTLLEVYLHKRTSEKSADMTEDDRIGFLCRHSQDCAPTYR